LLGLAYLHGLGIVHRDVKGGNLLVTEKGDIKLADFGVSEKLEKTLGEIAGTPLWMAPEVAKRGEAYNHKADIWSLGITLIELIDGVPPLSELNAYRVMMAIQKNDPPTVSTPREMSSNFLDFLSKCLVKDYNLRWDTDELLKHPFLSSAKKSDLKVLLEKTLKRREVHKRTQVPLIDHTSLDNVPPESPRQIAAASEPAAAFVPLENSAAVDSMILHSSTPILPEPVREQERVSVIEIPVPAQQPTEKKGDKNLAWQQPGYSSKDADARFLESPRIELDQSSPRTNESSPLMKSNPKPKEEESTCCSSCTIL